VTRWSINDPVAGDSFRFARNPSAMSSVSQPHRTTSHRASPVDGKIRAMRAPDQPFLWQFTGKVRTDLEYKHLLEWSERRNRVRITDHLGRVHEVLIQGFEATPVERSGNGNGWLFTYTVKTLYFRRIA
jgi:hypothetical protein